VGLGLTLLLGETDADGLTLALADGDSLLMISRTAR
jgi:hypothetical protein